MARPALPSNSLSAAVRQHFGLTQAELGRFLGTSGTMVAHAEAGRKTYPAATQRRLRPLALLLPPPDGLGPAAPVPPTAEAVGAEATALEAAPLQARLRRVRYLADKARFELENHHRAALTQARRQWGRTVLAALLAPPPGTPPVPAALAADPALDAAAARHWLTRLPVELPGAFVPLSASEAALLVLRLRLLDTEAEALTALLAATPPPPN